MTIMEIIDIMDIIDIIDIINIIDIIDIINIMDIHSFPFGKNSFCLLQKFLRNKRNLSEKSVGDKKKLYEKFCTCVLIVCFLYVFGEKSFW